MKHVLYTACCALMAAIIPATVQAENMPDPESIVQVELLADTTAVEAGTPVTLGVHYKIAKDWHIYWKNPGESGLATSVKLELPEGWAQGDVQYPAPITFEAPGPLMSYGYEGEVVLFVKATPPANLPASGNVNFTAKSRWLMCSDRCIPGKKDLSLKLAIGKKAPANKALFDKFLAQVPEKASKLPANVTTKLNAAGKKLDLTLTFAPLAGTSVAAENKGHDIQGLYFFPENLEDAVVGTPKLSAPDGAAGGVKTYARPATISYSVEGSGQTQPKALLKGVLAWQELDASGKPGVRKTVDVDLPQK
jgi:DsbC/DsbD-like thiol-disulfide interchange protein